MTDMHFHVKVVKVIIYQDPNTLKKRVQQTDKIIDILSMILQKIKIVYKLNGENSGKVFI